MNRLKLRKQKKPDFDELCEMLADLKDFSDENPDFSDVQWRENLDIILDFQDEDGSFKLFDSFDIPADARVDFCYTPTYICTAALMKAYLLDADAFSLKEKSALREGLKMSCARKLRGHGYEAFKGQIEALNIFMKAGLREFLDLHWELCPEFSEMCEKIISDFSQRESEEKFKGSWGESYESEIKQINEYFSSRKVFVYGTLMSGQTNHRYLEDSECIGKSAIEGYDMYSAGWYPAIIAGDGLIVGELYCVPLEDMPAIDRLEGDGSLYAKKCETITDAQLNKTLAFVYVYLEDVSELEKISAWDEEYLWYVSYGSNMLYDRFMCYIKGGSFEKSRYHPPCEDTAPPAAVRDIELPYGMYFGNTSGSWHGSGVSFLDITCKGRTLGVAYLITKKQFEHVCCRENDGRKPNPDYGWYEDILSMGEMDGFEMKTVTNNDLRPYNLPSLEYLETLKRGIRQNWPEMSESEIEEYLEGCIRRP